MKVDYNFSINIRRTIDIASKNLKDFIKKDFKYILVPFFTFFVFLNAFGFLIIGISPNSTIYSTIGLFLLLLTIPLLFYTGYLFTWLSATKSFHVVQEYTKGENSYVNTLEMTKKSKLRPFIGTIISGLIIFAIAVAVYFVVFVVLFGAIRFGNINPLQFFSLFLIAEIAPLLLISYLLIPLQMYPSILLIEDKIGYQEGISRSFKLLTGWKTKIKFFLLYYILNYITNLVLEVALFAIIVGTIIVALFIYTIIHGTLFWIVIIELVIVIFSLFMAFTIEAETIVSGTFYGQSYVNLALPDLMPPSKVSYTNMGNVGVNKYCVNCGQPLDGSSIFCPNCGAPVKYK